MPVGSAIHRSTLQGHWPRGVLRRTQPEPSRGEQQRELSVEGQTQSQWGAERHADDRI